MPFMGDMNCLRCQRALNEKGECSCGFSLFEETVWFTGVLPGAFLEKVQVFSAQQGALSDAELTRLSSRQLYEMASKIIDSDDQDADYQQAVRYYRLAAEKGHAQAQFCLGQCYEYGIGLSGNHPAAIKWYELAARQQIAEAQYRLGYLYRNGIGVTRDSKKCVYWLERAAYAGVADAQYLLGWMYRNSSGVKKDLAKALYWTRLASEQGHREAMSMYYYMKTNDCRPYVDGE